MQKVVDKTNPKLHYYFKSKFQKKNFIFMIWCMQEFHNYVLIDSGICTYGYNEKFIQA